MPNRLTLALGLAAAPALAAAQHETTRVSTQSHVVMPAKAEATPSQIDSLQVPEGFRVEPFASGLKNARILAVSPEGRVYVSRRDQGDVLLLEDGDGDGRTDGQPRTVANRPGAHGIAIHDGRFYLTTVKELFVADIRPDGSLGELQMLIDDLPDGGQHANRVLAFGPDGQIYYSAGSTCNACNETNPENATLLRISPDGKSRTIFASGLRNTIGYDWNPETGELWGMDQGIDFLGDDAQPEELNRIVQGKQYGWPHVHGDGQITPWTTPAGDITKQQWKAMSEPMVAGYTPHAAAMQMVFYPGGNFPGDYEGDAFITMRGSWNRQPPSGYELVRLRFDDQGRPQEFEPFVTGFVADGGSSHFARPVGLAVAGDGALLMSDDANGVIYRISYGGDGGPSGSGRAGGARDNSTVPAGPMQEQARQGTGVPVAIERDVLRTEGSLDVSSPDLRADAPIPARFSEYGEGLSPALRWSAVEGAKSYLVIVEDPDARPTTPFVHWVAWNIPADVTALPQGLQEQARLTDPEGVLQGRTSRGSTGWYGPRPPVGDPPHHYHFQVFALDTELDVQPGADRDAVLDAAAGHVIAVGELVSTFQQQSPPTK